LAALGACTPAGPGEVHAAEPAVSSGSSAATEPATAVALTAPRVEAARTPPAEEAKREPQDLATLVQHLDAGDTGLRLAEGDLELLFTRPRDVSGSGPYANHALLDVLGGPGPEAVVVIGSGWWGRWMRVCVFERGSDGWTLAHTLRIDGPCRGLPTTPELASTPDGRWLRTSWIDGWGSGINSDAVGLFEVTPDGLELVLRASDSGWVVGWGNPIDVEYRPRELRLEAEGDAVRAALVLHIDATPSERLAGSGLEGVECDVELVFRQARPAEPFELVAPLGAREADQTLVVGLAERAWLTERVDEACALALDGPARHRLLMLDLAESVLELDPIGEARALIALIPARASLEAERDAGDR